MILVRKEATPLHDHPDLDVAHENAQTSSGTLATMYDRYFSSGFYNRRYAGPNPYLFQLLSNRISDGDHVLDFGCGNGRYLAPLAVQNQAQFYGFDISAQAIDQLSSRLSLLETAYDVSLYLDRMDLLEEEAKRIGGFDHIMMLFGVLSHIEGRSNRLNLLRRLRGLLKDGGVLTISVPNQKRRFRAEQKNATLPVKEAGDVYYSREEDGVTLDLFYHLYSQERIQKDIEDAGFHVQKLVAESILAERVVTRSAGAFLDQILRPITPLNLAYGFLVEAV